MKKVLLSCFFAFLSFINTKCSKGEKMGFNSRTIKNRQMAETIINCISKKDSETLKSVFSEDTLNNVQTLDNDIKRLFAYCNGNVTSYKEFSSASFTDIDVNLNSTEFNTTY